MAEKEESVVVDMTEGDTPQMEIDIVDDTPAEDKGKPHIGAIDAEDGDEELSGYNEKVQKRIKKLTRGYNDERRAKEAAFREREEAVAFAKKQHDMSRHLQKQLSEGSEHYIATSKYAAESAVSLAKKQFKDAHESNDSDAIADAQEALTAASLRKEQTNALRPLHFQEDSVYNQPKAAHIPEPDSRAQEWQEENDWFGADTEMTSLALGIHENLVKSGIDPTTEKYYERVDARMREIFPDKFRSKAPPVERTPARAKSGNVVAPATRSAASKRVTLTGSQVAIAKRLGLTNAQYAHELMKLGG